MGHSVNLLPEALGTILNCFMNFDFNNMIVRRVWGGGRQYLLPLPKHPTEKHLLTLSRSQGVQEVTLSVFNQS